MTKILNIGGQQVAAGQRRSINIPVAHLYTHTEMTMPVHVLRGKKDGPRLFVCAAIHGDEIIGVEIIRRLLKLKILQRLRGTLIAVPVVNVYGFINHTRYLPDRRDLNRYFPGSLKGSLTSRLANIFMEEIVAISTHGIDLHAGSHHRMNLPHIRACLNKTETEQLAFAFGAPVILNADFRDGSLRQAVEEVGIPMLLYEAGEALRFDEFAVRAGVKGILGVMRFIGMLTSRSIRTSRIQPMVASSTSWVRAPGSGILRTQIPLGGKIAANQIIGEIADPFDEHETAVISPVAGIVIGRMNLPLVHKGDALFHVASFEDSMAVSESLDDFKEEIGESLPSPNIG
ncbi:MAG: succinylglutamate desuccinylase/aspartoacylase family protein [Deltaproteobacteria bacterium]|nr:succinylglutamate desuccinylase/aspartoacylase family protein [Deltaproteobacteria bacterium]